MVPERIAPEHVVNGFLEGLKALGPGRLTAMGAVAIAMLGLLALLMLHGPTEQMALLYADLDSREAGQIVDILERQRIPHQLSAGGAQVLVPADQVSRVRLLLAKSGLPTGGSIGYEIFDRGDALTTSQFQQQINETRALEGELVRTIRGLSGVRGARVHLVLPRREPFSRNSQEAQASVMLTMAGAARMDKEGVQAILNLVSAAVPGLRPQNIAIVDSRGNVLARAGQPAGPAAAAQSTQELRQATELRLGRAVEEMLERSLGQGRVRAEATVDMDFDQVHETQERFDPDGQVVRSTQTVDGKSRTTEASNTVSVQNNLPNADAGQSGNGSQEQKQEETTNYEISKTVRTLVHDQPMIRRINMAVMVDGSEGKDAQGRSSWQPRSQAELDQIARLVRTAIGYDEKRGDHVEVVNMRFAEEGVAVSPDSHGLWGLSFERADIMRLIQTGLLGVVIVAALLLVLRPMVMRLTTGSSSAGAITARAGSLSALPAAGGIATQLAPADAALLLGGPAAGTLPSLAAPPPEDESMVKLSNIEGQMRASSLRKLSEMVDKHPEESLSIVRAWMQQVQ